MIRIRRFTGWHMLGVMVAFFGVVIGVNVVMATQAVETFGGTVVENSYVASQRFNGWLGKARAQDQAGWRADARIGELRLVTAEVATAAGPLDGARVTVEATHPLGRLPARTLELRSLGGGRYVATQALPAGRWLLRIDVQASGHEARFEDEVRS